MKRFLLIVGVLLFFVGVGVVSTLAYLGRPMPYRFRDLGTLESARDSAGALVIRFTPPPESATVPALAEFELRDKKIFVRISRRAVFARDWFSFRSLASTGSKFESRPHYDAASQSFVSAAPPFHGADAPFVYLDESGEHPFR